MSDCIFCKIVAGEIPSRKVYEDEDILAFHDIKPAAPVHFLIIPKKHIPTLADATEEDIPVMGKIMTIAGQLAKQEGCHDGFRTIVNTGRVGCQEVYHVHVHILGGNKPLGVMLGMPAL
ncbi:MULTISPECIES: histidine triad nucleotide-binding protein [Limnobacter]|jgi:histidine triad (HIT) family protein|uniref:histidine triad nucleotide-binding protein n=1 Tax=Limnobacter TaxID=131079 RepID=UPI0007A8E0E5|nr:MULTISPECIES: histidine triad nucleotide-binding protein [unclassified Limnobacter]KYP12529.1 MAG: histidine triad nucleotide-binding protein [Limnobacter sp. CACIAM 66H1]